MTVATLPAAVAIAMLPAPLNAMLTACVGLAVILMAAIVLRRRLTAALATAALLSSTATSLYLAFS